ncbi:phosphatidate cytidylyltransferase [Butyricicoccus sp.]|uniref:phosphatidate cytidylyltransferase n=1 Tax=Butyricicoccus sp. TaxID=2049021 RepID=UPI0037350B32
MKTRVTFGVVGAVFVVVVLFFCPSIVAQLCMMALSVIAAQEFTAAVVGKDSKPLQIAAMLLALGTSMASARNSYSEYWLRAMLLAGVVVLFAILLRCHKKIGFTEIAGAYFGGIIIPYMLMSLIRMFTMTEANGKVYILIPLLAAWGSDTFALFAGMAFGKHKLAPVISPKKTIEGSVGGVVGAVVLMVVYGLAVNALADAGMSIALCIAIGLFGAVLGQVGDLSFSIVKRKVGIKDYGKIFPGHGGVLDRFDSVIFVAPAVELLLHLFTTLGI